MYRSIIVPLDGSVLAEWALPTAISIAQAMGARLDIVNVEIPVPNLIFGLSTTENAANGSLTEGRLEYLNDIAGHIVRNTSLAVETQIRHGNAAELITRAATESNADLIVMTTHGRGAVRRLWLGSVATEVAHRARQPVLLRRPPKAGRPAIAASPLFRHVLVPLDASPYSEEVLTDAVALGRLGAADYTLMHVIEPTLLMTALPLGPVAPTVDPGRLKEARKAVEAHLRTVAERLRKRELKVETMVAVEAHTAGAILEFAREHSIDLIALTTHGRSGLGRLLLGSVADKLIRAARVPVLVYRPAGG